MNWQLHLQQVGGWMSEQESVCIPQITLLGDLVLTSGTGNSDGLVITRSLTFANNCDWVM